MHHVTLTQPIEGVADGGGVVSKGTAIKKEVDTLSSENLSHDDLSSNFKLSHDRSHGRSHDFPGNVSCDRSHDLGGKPITSQSHKSRRCCS